MADVDSYVIPSVTVMFIIGKKQSTHYPINRNESQRCTPSFMLMMNPAFLR